jgi:hypothetical protein
MPYIKIYTYRDENENPFSEYLKTDYPYYLFFLTFVSMWSRESSDKAKLIVR